MFALVTAAAPSTVVTVTFLPEEEEIERLFSAIDSIRDRAIFRMACHAGLRASEVGLLQLRATPLSFQIPIKVG